MLKNADGDEKVPIRYSLSSIDSLYEKFLSESHLNCNTSYFKKNIPFYLCYQTKSQLLGYMFVFKVSKPRIKIGSTC